MAEQFTPTITPNATGSAGTAGAVIEGQQEVNKWKNIFAVGQGAAQLGTQLIDMSIADEQAKAKADKAVQDDMDKELKLKGYAQGQQFVINNSDVDPLVSSQAYEAEIARVVGNEENMPYAYRKGLLEAINASYVSTGKEANKIARDKHTAYSSNAMAITHFGSVDSNAIKADIASYAERTNTDIKLVRDSYLSSHYGMLVNQVDGINDIDALNEFKKATADIESSLRKDPQLFGSKSTGNIKEILDRGRSDYKAAVDAAQTRIFTKLDAERAEADGTFNMLPHEYNTNLIKRFGASTNKDYIVKSAEYAKNFETHTINRGVKSRFSPEAPMSFQDQTRVAQDPNLKKELKNITTDSLNTIFESRSTVDVIKGIRTISVNPALSKDFGGLILSQYNGALEEPELENFYSKFNMWRSTSNGTNALKVAMGNAEYNTVMMTGMMKDLGYAGNYTQARENLRIAGNSPEVMNAPLRDDDTYEYGRELGTRRKDFEKMTRILMANGATEEDAAEAVYERMIESDKKFSGAKVPFADSFKGFGPIQGAALAFMRKASEQEEVTEDIPKPTLTISGLPPMEYGNEDNVHEMLTIRLQELLGADADLEGIRLEGIPGGKGQMFIRTGDFNTAVAVLDMNEIIEDANTPTKLVEWRKNHAIRASVVELAQKMTDSMGEAFSLDRTEARQALRNHLQYSVGRNAKEGEIDKWVDELDQQLLDMFKPRGTVMDEMTGKVER